MFCVFVDRREQEFKFYTISFMSKNFSLNLLLYSSWQLELNGTMLQFSTYVLFTIVILHFSKLTKTALDPKSGHDQSSNRPPEENMIVCIIFHGSPSIVVEIFQFRPKWWNDRQIDIFMPIAWL